jgi:hypothetical protein
VASVSAETFLSEPRNSREAPAFVHWQIRNGRRVVIRHRVVLFVVAAVVVALVSLPAGAQAANGWGGPKTIDPLFDTTGISCASVAFCAAVSDTGSAAIRDGSGWQTPEMIDPGGHLQDVSCPTTTFCMAVDNADDVLRFDGNGWSAMTPPGDAGQPNAPAGMLLTHVSCGAPDFCVAIAEARGLHGEPYHGGSYTFNGTGWAYSEGGAFLPDISCPATDDCVAIGASGPETYDGHTWTVSSDTAPSGTVSCSSTTFCETTTGYQFDGTSWSQGPAPTGSPTVISCTSSTYCLATGDATTQAFDGSAWKAVSSASPDQTSLLSCARSTTFCAAASSQGRAATYEDNEVASRSVLGGGLQSVSCPSDTMCQAIDIDGRVTTYDGARWTAPAVIDQRDLNAISCPTTTFCVAVDQGGAALTWRNGGWTTTASVDTSALRDVACAAASFCVATDVDGRSLTYDGTSWGPPVAIGFPPSSISCPTTTFCAAQSVPSFSTFDGTTWATPTSIPTRGGLSASVSCTSATFCMSVGNGTATYDGHAWHPLTSADQQIVSCSSSARCAAVGGDDGFNYADGAWSDTSIDLGSLVETSFPVVELTGVSCSPSGACEAIDRDGRAVSYTPPTVRPAATTAPAITGSAVRGGVLRARTGTWTGTDPLAYAYRWQRCRRTCSTVRGATRATYHLGLRDLGMRLRVTVTASNVAGAQSAQSAMVGPVQPTSAQIRTALAPGTRARGPGARLRRLVARGGYTPTIRAPGPGRLTITWMHGHTKVASTAWTFSRVVTRHPKVRLTAAGRRLLRRSRTLTVHARATFTPTGGRTLTRRGTLRLRR